MNILFLSYDKAEANAFYRSSGIAPDLAKQSGYNITCCSMSELPMNWANIASFDLIMLQRPHTTESLNLCKFIKQCNVKLWIDHDDNLFAVNPENRHYLSIYSKPQVKENIRLMIEMADVVSVTNEYLRVVLSSLNKNIWVIPNAFNDSMIKRTELRKREKLVVWRGGDSHIYDLMQYGTALNEVMESNLNFEFLFMGYYPWFLSDKATNKSAIEMQDIILYFKNIFKLAPSVFHIPLHDNNFNHCRSNIGYIEGSFAGAVCIAPDWWNVPGSLLYSDPFSYLDAFKSVLSGEVDIQTKNSEAWEYISDCLFLSKVNKQRIKLIQSL